MASWTPSTYSTQQDPQEDDSFGELDARGLKDHLIFIVDCSSQMWTEASNALGILATIVDVYKTKAGNGGKDELSIILYGTRENDNENKHPHIVVLHPLQIPTAETILKLLEITGGGKEAFETEYGIVDRSKVVLSDVMWTARSMFGGKKYVGMKRVMFFTNDDNPHGSSTDIDVKRRSALTNRIRDMMSANVGFDLFGVSSDNHVFDYDLFYAHVLPPEEDGSQSFKSYKDTVELSLAVRKKKFSKRALSRLTFKLADGVIIGVSLYGLIVESKKPTHSYRDARTLDVVEPLTKWRRADTNEEVILGDTDMPEEQQESGEKQVSKPSQQAKKQSQKVLPAFKYAGSLIPFTHEEVSKIKNVFQNGIELLCFKKRSSLRIEDCIRAPYFIYPDESTVVGSITAFSALLQTMLSHDKIAICRYKPRTNSLTRLVALLPQMEVRDSNGIQEKPPGFHLIPLPFADDVRTLNPVPVSEATPAQVDAMKSIISKLTISNAFHPTAYPNPVLQNYNSVIEALALELEEPEQWVDTVQPPIGRFERCTEFFSVLESSMPTFETAKPSKKRGASNEDEGDAPKSKKSATKKKKREDVSDMEGGGPDGGDIDEELWKKQHKDGKISKFTVPELKEFLAAHNIRPKGKKADLVAQVEEYFAES